MSFGGSLDGVGIVCHYVVSDRGWRGRRRKAETTMTAAERAAATERAKANIVRRGEREWIVPSRSEIGTVYIVAERAGVTTCNCPAAINAKRCWHIAAVEERYGLTLRATMDVAEPEWVRRGFKADPAVGLAILTGKRS